VAAIRLPSRIVVVQTGAMMSTPTQSRMIPPARGQILGIRAGFVVANALAENKAHELTMASAELITPNCSLLIPISFRRVLRRGPKAEFAQFIPDGKTHSDRRRSPIGMIITAARLIHFTVQGIFVLTSS
jgi:hypothetical protein